MNDPFKAYCKCTKDSMVLMRYLDCEDCSKQELECIWICVECGDDYDENYQDYKTLERIDKDIILDYVWENTDMMDQIREWIKDVYE